MLEPILDGSKTIEHQGRFRIQLDISSSSTLKEGDIEKILRASSWEVNPESIAIGSPGGRAISTPREESLEDGGIVLDLLNISGIGYNPLLVVSYNPEFGFKSELMYEEGFQPPSNRNFIDFTPETYRTSYADNGLKHRRGKFCPLGSYTNRQVRKKVENTSLVNSLGLKSLLVPKIEAYGRYLDENLRDEDGQFGFVVYSVPSDKRVAGSELEEEFAEMMGLTESGDPTKVIATLLRKYTKNLMGGLKELHDKGYCHLQGHMGQFYDFPERPYLVDWETMIPLGRTVQDRLLNREIDISKPLSSVWRMMGKSQTSGEEAMEFVNQVKPYLLGDYLGISPDQISKDRRAAMIRLSKGRRGVMVMEDDVSGLVLQKHGIERSPLKKNQAKIGRNDPCPCGSGIKFKKCCGGHK